MDLTKTTDHRNQQPISVDTPHRKAVSALISVGSFIARIKRGEVTSHCCHHGTCLTIDVIRLIFGMALLERTQASRIGTRKINV